MNATVKTTDKGAVYYLDGAKVRGSKRDYLFDAMLVCEVDGKSSAVCLGNRTTCEREYADRMILLKNARQWLDFLKGTISEIEFLQLKKPMDRQHYRTTIKDANKMSSTSRRERISYQEQYIESLEKRNYTILPITVEN